MINKFAEFPGGRADRNVTATATTQKDHSDFREKREGKRSPCNAQARHHVSAAFKSALSSNFCLGQCRKGDNSRSGTIFDLEFAQDVFDVLADRPGACAEDHADLIVRFTLCDPSQNLCLARGETQ